VPTKETTPIWAQTNPAAPAHKKGDPDWSKPEEPSNGEGNKPAQAWAETVPTSPGDPEATSEEAEEKVELQSEAAVAEATEPPAAEPPTSEPAASTEPTGTEPPATESPATAPPTPAPLTGPPKAVAADAMKSTWPPAAASSPAPPEETDIWPPEPPTEHAMPAWPPPSELEEPATPAQAIPSWPDSFEAAPAAQASTPPAAASVPPTITPEAKPTVQVPPATIQPAPAAPAPPAPSQPPVPTMPVAPEAASQSPAAAAPARPSQPGPAPRPAWAPGPAAEPPATGKTPSVQAVQVPAWAPRVPLASEPGTPTWFSPKEEIPHATAQPIAQPARAPEPEPAPPVVGGQLPVAQIPTPQLAAQQPAPQQPGQRPSRPAWQVVEQPRKSGPHAPVQVGPTAEDRSYAEWFAWAKRGGAPASVCHAAAQGAFKALSSGKDVNTAVQWATAAMSQPPEQVSQTRAQYCAWFALANIDLNLDQHRAHLFAAAALQALDAGQDASAAHAAGLAAAGIR
jgi:hypothetical protein